MTKTTGKKSQVNNLKQSVKRLSGKMSPSQAELDSFENSLNGFLQELSLHAGKYEEHQKNECSRFLQHVLPNYYINTLDNIDLAIHNGSQSASSAGVLIEFKSLTNSAEMCKPEHINAKALQELIWYFFKEKKYSNNLYIHHCIVTNGLEWFVFESKDINKYFYNNRKLHQLMDDFHHNRLEESNTGYLYRKIGEFIQPVEQNIPYTYFNIADFCDKKSGALTIRKENLLPLYLFFRPENLLNKELPTDPNTLNSKFYHEFLYLIGLEEKEKDGIRRLQRLPVADRQPYSLIENIIEQLSIREVEVEDQEEIAMQLAVIWINRILFLKLLESQLISFNDDDEAFRFLDIDHIPNFKQLYVLFFAILARKDRDPLKYGRYSYIPYLNSSLFEEDKIEREFVSIQNLDEGKIDYYRATVLTDSRKNRLKGKENFLTYLFNFLDAFDFSTEQHGKRQSKNDLINASVLGLIFEKINGYKEGSFFTPGSVTMHMTRETIQATVIEKVNSEMGWNCSALPDIAFKIDSVATAGRVSDIISSIRICDPAVGSGHFLVSALNELISIKFNLGLLMDPETGPLKMQISRCEVKNDDLIIEDSLGNPFKYRKNNKISESIQRVLFNEKKNIIENCLFGADINPSSANICRLRLWIELLKSSYYTKDADTGQDTLVTLPNIDINIKVGNSLLYRYDFSSHFDRRRSDFKEYLRLVREYKNTNNKKIKKDLWNRITSIKLKFDDRQYLPEFKLLKSAHEELDRLRAEETRLFYKEDESSIQARLKQAEKNVLLAEENLKKKMDSPMLSQGLEWRMEFPEILDENGDFVGFDILIGNPPYIFARNQGIAPALKKYFEDTYSVEQYQANTYPLFIELSYHLLRPGGRFAFIIPNNFLTIPSNSKLRKFLVMKTGDLRIVNSFDKIFSNASVDNAIVYFKKTQPACITLAEIKNREYSEIGSVPDTFFGEDPIFSFAMVKYQSAKSIYDKMNQLPSLAKTGIAKTYSGIKAYEVGKGTPRMTREDQASRIYHAREKTDETYLPYYDGENVCRYELTWNGEYIKYGKNLAAPRKPELFQKPRILIRQIPSAGEYAIQACYVDGDEINDLNSMILSDFKVDPYYLLGILNSKLMTVWFLIHFDKFQRKTFPQFKLKELEEFPFPDAASSQQAELSGKVQKIMNAIREKKESGIIQSLNKEIDEYVMDLYQLNDSEKEIIRQLEIRS